MTPLGQELSDRREEFDTHMALAAAVEGRIFEGEIVSIGETELSVRHLRTIKSGLVVHLYNVVEAMMTRAMEGIGRAIGSVSPAEWTQRALREWLRKHAAVPSDGGEEGRLRIVETASTHLLTAVPMDAQSLKKPSGTWSDKTIFTLARRLGIEIALTPDLQRQIAKRPIFGDKTPMVFLADRRNAIAHGRRTFEDGAEDLSLQAISELADVAFEFLASAMDAFEGYVASEGYRGGAR